MSTLDDFSAAFGLRVTFEKSFALTSKRIARAKRDRLACISNIRFYARFGKYRGYPLLQGRARKEDFNFLVVKLESWLTSWKGKLLNKAGTVALANSVLTSIHIHVMQTM